MYGQLRNAMILQKGIKIEAGVAGVSPNFWVIDCGKIGGSPDQVLAEATWTGQNKEVGG